MRVFKNILVGVDLAQCRPYEVAGLNPVAMEPILWSIRLAKLSAARLLFFAAANIGEEALTPLTEADRSHVRETVYHLGGQLLQQLVQQAQAEGIDARGRSPPARAGWRSFARCSATATTWSSSAPATSRAFAACCSATRR